jgi:AcrR family transcriptional regulator
MVYGSGREALLRAGQEAVSEHGIDGLTTREVCARAGVGAPTLYHHFGSREGLLEELLREAEDRYLAGKDELATTGDAVADMRSGWDHHIAFARSNAALYPLLLRPDSETSTRSLARLHSGFERLQQEGRLRDGVTAAEATIVLSSAVRGVALRISHAPEDPELLRASDLLRDAVIDALLTPEEGSSRVALSTSPTSVEADRQHIAREEH